MRVVAEPVKRRGPRHPASAISAVCLAQLAHFVYSTSIRDANVDALWKLQKKTPVQHYWWVSASLLWPTSSKRPLQTSLDQTAAAWEQTHGLWPRCCSHTSTANHREFITRDKNRWSYSVGICIKTKKCLSDIQDERKTRWEIVLNLERKSKWHVALISSVSFKSQPSLSGFRHAIQSVNDVRFLLNAERLFVSFPCVRRYILQSERKCVSFKNRSASSS